MRIITYYYWAYDNYYYKVDYWYDIWDKCLFEIPSGTALPVLEELEY